MPHESNLHKKEEFHLTSYSKWDDLDLYMNQGMLKKFGDRFLKYREKWKKTFTRKTAPKFPLMVGIEATDSCNYKCKMCYRKNNPNTSTRLGYKKIISIIDEGSKYQLPSLAFGGGADEPFMEKKIMKILEYAIENGIMDILLTSNGSLIDNACIEKIVALGISRIQISLDASSQGVYTKIRGGHLATIEEMIRYCHELKLQKNAIFPIIRLSFVIQDENKHEMEAFLNKWKNIADKIDFQHLIDYQANANLEREESKRLFCAEPWQRVNIWADGTITPCCTFFSKHFKLGNIHGTSIFEAWTNPVIQELRNRLVSGDFPRACINCSGDLSD